MLFLTPHEAKLLILLFMAMIITCSMYACRTAHAYIISSRVIFDRVVAQHGKGTYSIEQDVTFRDGIDTLTVKENWLIVDGSEMRVQVQSEGFRLSRILKRKKVYSFEGGSEKAEDPRDYFMSALLTRGATEEKRFFARWNILPNEAFQEKKPKDLKAIRNETEPGVRLSRTAGAMAYAFGQPSPVDGAPLPGLWIEQDSFLIRKMRTPSGAEITAGDYLPYSKGLWYPRSQTIAFNNHIVNIRVRSISSIELSADQKKQLDPAVSRSRVDMVTTWPKTSLGPLIQDFYKRFR